MLKGWPLHFVNFKLWPFCVKMKLKACLLSIDVIIHCSYFQAHQSNRVCNALALLQCVASHPETRSAFLQGMYRFGSLDGTRTIYNITHSCDEVILYMCVSKFIMYVNVINWNFYTVQTSYTAKDNAIIFQSGVWVYIGQLFRFEQISNWIHENVSQLNEMKI